MKNPSAEGVDSSCAHCDNLLPGFFPVHFERSFLFLIHRSSKTGNAFIYPSDSVYPANVMIIFYDNNRLFNNTVFGQFWSRKIFFPYVIKILLLKNFARIV